MFFGGKGGVGKTTCSAAYALALAARSTARRPVLLLSTDPAHSLGDALGVRLTSRPRPIAGGVDAAELDAPRALARWVAANRSALSDALEHGTWLDRGDVEALLDLPLPGIDELAGMLEIARLAPSRPSRYATIVIDTAPTGHALRLLGAPEAVGAVAAVLDSLQQEHRMIRAQLARVGREEAADRLITLLAGEAHALAALLRDRSRTSFRWVMLPEALSLAETDDAVAALKRTGLAVDEIVVNRVLTDEGPCPICDRRRAAEARTIAGVRTRLGRGRRIRLVAAAGREPRGRRALLPIGRTLIESGSSRLRALRVLRGGDSLRVLRTAMAVSVPDDAPFASPDQIPILHGPTLLFVGGKGGVGKTTIAAAIALRLARADPRTRTLLLSTDPAHSIADVLGVDAIGDEPIRIDGAPENLAVREVDAAAALARQRADLQAAIDEIAAAVGAGIAATDSGAAELMDLAPPGIDELFGMLSVIDARRDYDVIVVDTAPAGHALRLLELPDAAREWVQLLLRVLLKYRELVRPGQLAAELVDLSKSMRALTAMLRDPAQTAFLVVTRAAAVPQAETERLLARLDRLGLAVPAVIVNALTLAPGDCRRCRATAAAERRIVEAWTRGARSARRVIIDTPLAAPPPRGAAALDTWSQQWIVARGVVPRRARAQ